MHDIRSTFVAGEGVRKPTLVAPKQKKPDAKGSSLMSIPVARTAARVTDHRREDRLRDLTDVATVTFRRKKVEVAVVNMSSLGTMIESDIEPRIGEVLQIQFAGCNQTRCTVRWMKNERIGLEFEQQTDIIGLAKTRAYVVAAHAQIPPVRERTSKPMAMRETRHGLIWTGTLYWSFEAFNVRLRNISADGAMLECDSTLKPGSVVRLNLAEAGTLAGEVRWSRTGQVGILFDEKFDLRLLANAKPTGCAADYMLKPEYLKSEGAKDSPWAAMWDKFGPDDLTQRP
jgi:hypothetical protein